MKIRWWRWLPFQDWRVVGTFESADEIPDRLPRNGVVLVESGARTKWIVFDCPCRAGHRIMLNADQNRFPVWQFKLSESNLLSITPSIDFQDPQQRCHFFLRKGKIAWVKDKDQ